MENLRKKKLLSLYKSTYEKTPYSDSLNNALKNQNYIIIYALKIGNTLLTTVSTFEQNLAYLFKVIIEKTKYFL